MDLVRHEYDAVEGRGGSWVRRSRVPRCGYVPQNDGEGRARLIDRVLCGKPMVPSIRSAELDADEDWNDLPTPAQLSQAATAALHLSPMTTLHDSP